MYVRWVDLTGRGGKGVLVHKQQPYEIGRRGRVLSIYAALQWQTRQGSANLRAAAVHRGSLSIYRCTHLQSPRYPSSIRLGTAHMPRSSRSCTCLSFHTPVPATVLSALSASSVIGWVQVSQSMIVGDLATADSLGKHAVQSWAPDPACMSVSDPGGQKRHTCPPVMESAVASSDSQP